MAHRKFRRQLAPGIRPRQTLNQIFYQGDEFQTAITASYDGTSDYNVVDCLRDCWLAKAVIDAVDDRRRISGCFRNCRSR